MTTQADAATLAANNLNDLEPALFDYHTKAEVEAIIRDAYTPLTKRAEANSELETALQRISDKCKEWEVKVQESKDVTIPWWNLGDIANATLKKYRKP